MLRLRTCKCTLRDNVIPPLRFHLISQDVGNNFQRENIFTPLRVHTRIHTRIHAYTHIHTHAHTHTHTYIYIYIYIFNSE